MPRIHSGVHKKDLYLIDEAGLLDSRFNCLKFQITDGELSEGLFSIVFYGLLIL